MKLFQMPRADRPRITFEVTREEMDVYLRLIPRGARKAVMTLILRRLLAEARRLGPDLLIEYMSNNQFDFKVGHEEVKQ